MLNYVFLIRKFIGIKCICICFVHSNVKIILPVHFSRGQPLYTVIAVYNEVAQYDDIEAKRGEKHAMFDGLLLVKATMDF